MINDIQFLQAIVPYKSTFVHINKGKNMEKNTEQKADYMNIDLTGYKPYLQAMARARRVSITKYIRDLIGADYEANKEEFRRIYLEEALQALEEAKNH